MIKLNHTIEDIVRMVSYRVDEGYVDFNIPEHLNALNEVLADLGLSIKEITDIKIRIQRLQEASEEPKLNIVNMKEAGRVLEYEFIRSGKKPSELGLEFERFIEKYFSGFKNTNIDSSTSFYDLKSGNSYYSLKYSLNVEKSENALGRIANDNFRSFPLSTLLNVIDDKGYSAKFGIIAGYSWIENDKIILRLLCSGVKTGKEILQVVDTFSDAEKAKYNKALRSAVVTKIFGYGKNKEFMFEPSSADILKIKNAITETLRSHFDSKEDLIRALVNTIKKYK